MFSVNISDSPNNISLMTCVSWRLLYHLRRLVAAVHSGTRGSELALTSELLLGWISIDMTECGE